MTRQAVDIYALGVLMWGDVQWAVRLAGDDAVRGAKWRMRPQHSIWLYIDRGRRGFELTFCVADVLTADAHCDSASASAGHISILRDKA